MSDHEEVQDDVSAFFDGGADSASFAEATDSVGLPDDPSVDQPLPNHIADQIEDYDRHAVDKDREPEEFVEEEPQQQKGSGKVPLGALQEERARRQEAQDRARALEQQLALLQAQLTQQQQIAQAQQQQVQQEAIPDPEEDPIGFIKAKERQLTEQLQNMQQAQEYERAAVQVHHRVQELGQFAGQAVATFEAEHPEYSEAFELVNNNAAAVLRQRHPGATDQEILQAQQVGLFQLLDHCQRTNTDPCRLVYEQAKALGFTPGQRVPDTRLPPKAPTSLSTLSAHGRAPDQQGTYKAKDIAGLSNEEFDKVFNSMRDGSVAGPAF